MPTVLLPFSSSRAIQRGCAATGTFASDFRPLPLFSNPHMQTLAAHFWRGHLPRLPTRRWRVPLEDGDSLILHDSPPPAGQPGKDAVLLVHGLGGSYRSPGIVRLAWQLWKRGWRVFRLDLRGAGAGAAWARLPYHAGCSDDVRVAIDAIFKLCPAAELTLVGLSLGGNIVLKLAGESAQTPVPGLARVVAVAPPVDLQSCSRLLQLPRNWLYERAFVQDLVRQARDRAARTGVPAPAFPPRLRLRDFDDCYTAPRRGFRDVDDYYARASSAPWLASIRVPTLILAAADDPLIDPEPLRLAPCPAAVSIRLTRHGGHLGFLGDDGQGGMRWAETALVRWILAHHYYAPVAPA